MLADQTHDARYADFYEYTMLNHILSTQDPTTGGYVYFTTLRPQGYRIYSQVNQAMWCCVGTGMENHSKYGHFAYTHDGDSVLYVNLFVPSTLSDTRFGLTQTTSYPYEQQSTITVDKAGAFTLAVRHPWWTTDAYQITVNGEKQNIAVQVGKASYVRLTRSWKKGDVIRVSLPMKLRVEECPNYTDYIAFEYGPVLLAAKTTAENQADADSTGLKLETLQNEYAGEGRMDHAPGSVGKSMKAHHRTSAHRRPQSGARPHHRRTARQTALHHRRQQARCRYLYLEQAHAATLRHHSSCPLHVLLVSADC